MLKVVKLIATLFFFLRIACEPFFQPKADLESVFGFNKIVSCGSSFHNLMLTANQRKYSSFLADLKFVESSCLASKNAFASVDELSKLSVLLPRTVLFGDLIGPTYGNVYCFYCNWDESQMKFENYSLYDWSALAETSVVAQYIGSQIVYKKKYRINKFKTL